MTTETEIAPKIDSKLPLPWILACTVTIALSMGSVFAKLDSVSATLASMQTKSEVRDERQAAVNQTVALQDVAVKQLQADMSGIKTSVAELQRTSRYIPK